MEREWGGSSQEEWVCGFGIGGRWKGEVDVMGYW